jgi:hypothetical protein
VNQDNAKAYFWLTLAARQHEKDAIRLRDRLAPKLSVDERAKAEASASSWKPKPAAGQNPRLIH